MGKDKNLNEVNSTIEREKNVAPAPIYEPFLKDAVTYDSMRLSVIPINEKKEPLVKGWKKNRIQPNIWGRIFYIL